ncbi:MAG: AsmA-like C-terminal region-containing protein [Terrimicrobiaceae bacterium]|nr:AsmA-like C-terminal region-containing protein [Terrimicrobiaceae bacterium]
MRRPSQFFLTLAATAVLLGVPVLLAYVQFVGFSAEWRAKVARALSGPAFTVEIGRLTFHPFEGIVAEGLNLYRVATPPRQVAQIDQLVISPNLSELLHGRVSIDRLNLENASIAIPFASDGVQPDAILLRDLRAEIWSGNGQVTISHAECVMQDIHVTLHGHLLLPAGGGMSRPAAPAHSDSRVALIRSVLAALGRIEFSAPKPELDIQLSGNIAQPETISADSVTLRAGGVRYDQLSFDHVNLSASYANRAVLLSSLRAAGKSGSMQIGGAWDFATGGGHLDASGGLAFAPLLRLAGRTDLATRIAFDHPPRIEATLTATPGASRPSISLIGQTSTAGFRLKGIRARSFATRFAWKDGRLFLQDAELQARTGGMHAQLLMGPGEFRLKLDSDADPAEFIELFGPNEQTIIRLLEFKDSPKLTIKLSGTRPSLDALAGEGHITLGRSAMRGSWIDSGVSDVLVADRAIAYKNLSIKKGPLRATGSFTYDFGRHQVRLDGIHSNLNPPDVLMWVDPRISATVAVYRFRSPPAVRADGIAGMQDPQQNDLRIQVDAPGGLTYTLLNRDLVFGDTQATVLLKGQQVLADVRRAALYGGEAAVTAKVSTAPDDPSFSAKIAVDRIDFPSLTKLYFGYAKSEGVMSGRYAFDSSLRDASKMRGSGSIRVEDGHVLAIPLFGPLSSIISTIIPGAGHESARLATADFTIADQLIRTKNLDISGSGFELFGDGSVGIPGGQMDLTVRINARGIPGLVLFPVSKLLEYVSTGTISNPQWRPKVIPHEFFDVLGIGGGDAAKPSNSGKTR